MLLVRKINGKTIICQLIVTSIAKLYIKINVIYKNNVLKRMPAEEIQRIIRDSSKINRQTMLGKYLSHVATYLFEAA